MKDNDYTLEQVYEFPRVEEFYALIKDFLARSGETERTFESIIRQLQKAEDTPDTLGLWLVKNSEGRLKGFFYSEIIETDYGRNAVMIFLACIDGTLGANIWSRLDDLVFKWSRPWNADGIYFTTRRNPVAFLKRINYANWQFDSYVLRRRFLDEANRQSEGSPDQKPELGA